MFIKWNDVIGTKLLNIIKIENGIIIINTILKKKNRFILYKNKRLLNNYIYKMLLSFKIINNNKSIIW